MFFTMLIGKYNKENFLLSISQLNPKAFLVNSKFCLLNQGITKP